MIKLDNCGKINETHIGMYARFEGHWLRNGFSFPLYKANLHLIQDITEEGIRLKPYHAHYSRWLPFYEFSQAVELYTPAEYKKMPSQWK